MLILFAFCAFCDVKVGSLLTDGGECECVELPDEGEEDGEDPLVLQRHSKECPGESPVLQTHHQDEHLRQQEELGSGAEGGVGPPGGRELEPDCGHHRPHARHRRLQPVTRPPQPGENTCVTVVGCHSDNNATKPGLEMRCHDKLDL